jgi:hypothetical protein
MPKTIITSSWRGASLNTGTTSTLFVRRIELSESIWLPDSQEITLFC